MVSLGCECDGVFPAYLPASYLLLLFAFDVCFPFSLCFFDDASLSLYVAVTRTQTFWTVVLMHVFSGG